MTFVRFIVQRTVPVAATVLVLAGCAGFGDYQSAPTVGEGNTTVTPTGSYTWLEFGDPGEQEFERWSRHLGARLTHGLGESFDITIGAEHWTIGDPDSEDRTSNWIWGVGPKLNIHEEDRLAVWIPIGRVSFDESDEQIGLEGREWQMNPTILYTRGIGRSVEVTSSVKGFIPINRDLFEQGFGDYITDGSYRIGSNLGLGISPGDSQFTIRPEGGFIWTPGDGDEVGWSSRTWHFGLGATVPLGS